MLTKITLREIKNSLGRYLAILIIVALGVGLFAGLKVTRDAMVDTLDEYLTERNLYDYQLISTLGYEAKDVERISSLDNVNAAEGSISYDVLCEAGEMEQVLKAYSIAESVNKVKLLEGRMPKTSDECVADGRVYSTDDIGKTIELSADNSKDTLDAFAHRKYTITGLVYSPLYLNYERGSTSLGNGIIEAYFYILPAGFDSDIYTEIYLTLDKNDPIYSDEYENHITKAEAAVTAAAEAASQRRYDEIKKEADDKIKDAQKEYDDGYSSYLKKKSDAYSELDSSYDKLVSGQSKIDSSEKKLNKTISKLNSSKKHINAGIAQIDQKLSQLEANREYMSDEEYQTSKQQLDSKKSELTASLAKVNAGLKQANAGKAKLEKEKQTLADGWSEYRKGKSEADSSFADAEKELEDAKAKIDDGKKNIADIKKPETFVFTRDINTGYAGFENDANIVNEVAKVFPVFFFLVAALVCITTMTRMVDEQRTQIGVLKALGYSSRSVISGYLFYSGSAGFLGTLIGYFSCCIIFPAIIWRAYGIMYDFGCDLSYSFNISLLLYSLAGALICSMGACLAAGLKDFRTAPSQLMRPKAPPSGKRILLERITPLWSRVSFLYKVTLRNLFRYKKRFFMMILGISGCTALLIAGFGINDTVKNIVGFQYNEIIKYDYSIHFSKALSHKQQQAFTEDTDSSVSELKFVHEEDVSFTSGEDETALTLIACGEENFSSFVDLHDSRSIKFPGTDNAVICTKLADSYDISKGDRIKLSDDDGNEIEVTVSGICKNYVNNYVYISDETYTEKFGKAPEYTTAYAISSDRSENGIYSSAAAVSDNDEVLGTSVCIDMENRICNMMDSLNAVIILIVAAAGALAFIVLYNLTNINITERVREIATIKVLGFYPKETSAYVFRENFILTGISAAVGLLLGKVLLEFIIGQINVSMITFDARITPLSYIVSVLLTFAFAVIVNIVMYYRLKKIDMIESLKSVE